MKLIVSIIVVGIQAIYAHSDNWKDYRCCRETDHYTGTEHTIGSIIIAGKQIIIKHRETDKDSIGVVGKQAIIHIERLPKAVLLLEGNGPWYRQRAHNCQHYCCRKANNYAHRENNTLSYCSKDSNVLSLRVSVLTLSNWSKDLKAFSLRGPVTILSY